MLNKFFKKGERKREKKKKRKEVIYKLPNYTFDILLVGILYSKKTHFLKKIIQSSRIYNLYYTYNFITK
jgi:hypothetical protein